MALIRLDGGAPPAAAKVPAPAYGAGRCIGPGGVYIARRPSRKIFPRIQALKIATARLLDRRAAMVRASSLLNVEWRHEVEQHDRLKLDITGSRLFERGA